MKHMKSCVLWSRRPEDCVSSELTDDAACLSRLRVRFKNLARDRPSAPLARSRVFTQRRQLVFRIRLIPQLFEAEPAQAHPWQRATAVLRLVSRRFAHAGDESTKLPRACTQ